MFHLDNEFYNLMYSTFASCGECDAKDCPPKKMNDFFNAIPKNKAIAMYGCGEVARRILSVLSYDNFSKITMFADKRAYKDKLYFYGKDILSPTELFTKKPEFIVLSVASFWIPELKEELLQIGFNESSFLEVPEFHENINSYFENNFCSNEIFCGYQMFAKNTDRFFYHSIFVLNDNYYSAKYCNDVKLIQYTLIRLIFGYLVLRDIQNSYKYIRKYVENGYENFEIFKTFLQNLNILLNNANESIKKKDSKSMIIYLFDAFSNKMVEYTENIKAFTQEAHTFRRAFTQYEFTTSSLQIMFSGNDLLDEHACEIKSFNKENSPLINAMVQNGYKLKYIYVWREAMFNECQDVDCIYASCESFALWTILNELSKETENCIYYAHMMESHTPYEVGVINTLRRWDYPVQFEQNADILSKMLGRQKAIQYIDEQFGFYNAFIPDSLTKIVMSDHSCFLNYDLKVAWNNYYDNFDYCCKNTRILLSIKSPYLEYGEDYNIFTLKDFYKLFLLLNGKAKLHEIYREYSKIQILPYYASHLIERWSPKLPLPMRGIVSADCIYLIDYNGEEKYYKDNSDNLIDDLSLKEEIEKVRTICGTDFGDIFEKPKFALAKKAYTQLGLIKE